MAVKEDTMAPALVAENPIKSVLIISDDGVNDLELFYPLYRFSEEGFGIDVVLLNGGEIKADHGFRLQNVKRAQDINPGNYALLYLPGGKAPAKLRKDPQILNLVRQFYLSGRAVAAICHGPQILVSANLVRGKKIAAYPEVEKEITDAGGQYINKPLVQDGQFITARWPGDLAGHVVAAIKAINAASSMMHKKAS